MKTRILASLVGISAVLGTAGCYYGPCRTPVYASAYADPAYIEVNSAPPVIPVSVELQPPKPSQNAVWVAGYWAWFGSWQWVGGRWETPRAGYAWQPPAFVVVGGSRRYHPGFWRPESAPPPAIYSRPGTVVVSAPPPQASGTVYVGGGGTGTVQVGGGGTGTVHVGGGGTGTVHVGGGVVAQPGGGVVVRPGGGVVTQPPPGGGVVVRPGGGVVTQPPPGGGVVVRPGNTGITQPPPGGGVVVRPGNTGITQPPPGGGVVVRPGNTGITQPPPGGGVVVRPGNTGITQPPPGGGVVVRPGNTGVAIRPGGGIVSNNPGQVQMSCAVSGNAATRGGYVTIHGQGLQGATVQIGGTFAAVASSSPTQITAQVAGNSSGGLVTVQNGGRTATCGSVRIAR